MNPNMKRWIKRIIKIAIVVSVFLFIVSFIFIEYSSRPEFCNSCHYMNPYYESWQSSSHKDVPCTDCHYPPGIGPTVKAKTQSISQVVKYFTKTYGTKPWAEISDESCLRAGCHNRRLIEGKVIFKNVLFDHKPHLTELRRGERLRCTSCHSQIVQGKHISVTESTCFLCHFKGMPPGQALSGCPSCHNAPTQTVEFQNIKFNHSDLINRGVKCQKCHISVIKGDGSVPRERCYNCHAEPEYIKKYGDSKFMHDNHVTKHKVECTQCHLEIQHKIQKMAAPIAIECQSCHLNQHTVEKELYMGIAGKNVDADPSAMFLARVSCSGCHIETHKGVMSDTTKVANDAACMNCHGTNYGPIQNQWIESIGRLIYKITPSIEIVEKELKLAERAGKNITQAKHLFENAKYNIGLVKYGKGVHNIMYSHKLLAAANKNLADALKSISSKQTIPPLPERLIEGTEECMQCHYGFELKTISFNNLNFKHEKHMEAEISCVLCHKKVRKEGKGHAKLTITLQNCQECHHRATTAKCETCHNVQADMYYGTNSFFPNVMAQKVDCAGCHKDGNAVMISVKDCATCHPKGYDNIMETWRTATQESLVQLETLLQRAARLTSIASANNLKNSEVAQRLYVEAKSDIQLIKTDGTMGIHNPDLADMHLERAKQKLNKCLKVLSEGN